MRSVAGRTYVSKSGQVVHLAISEGWASWQRGVLKHGRYIKTKCGKEIFNMEEAEGRLCFQCDAVHTKQERERRPRNAS